VVKKKIQAYAFIDTNIYLDFYRSNNEANLKLLEKLKGVKERIICTYQVEAEYMKNRQAVVLQSVRQLKHQVDLAIPAAIADKHLTESLGKLRDDAKARSTKIKNRVAKILMSPRGNDKVFGVLEEIFSSRSNHVLTRDMQVKARVKRLAFRRFLLGYPPRKASDTSMGDALNWEWIIYCAQSHPGRIIIVSRDCDYGHEYLGKYYLNSQLLQEFRERVGNKSIVYTRKLSEALGHLEVRVTQNEKKAEAAAIGANSAVQIDSQAGFLRRIVENTISDAIAGKQRSHDTARLALNELWTKLRETEDV
jgi:hypothetical protein